MTFTMHRVPFKDYARTLAGTSLAGILFLGLVFAARSALTGSPPSIIDIILALVGGIVIGFFYLGPMMMVSMNFRSAVKDAVQSQASWTMTTEGQRTTAAERFDRFTERARRVLTLAQDEAQRLKHKYIGTEHLLLGLLREKNGVAARVLVEMNIDLPKVRTAVEFIIGRGAGDWGGEVGLTPRAKRVIELAITEARGLEHDYIGTEHLLLGLVRERQGIAAGVLESLGANLETVRTAIAARPGGDREEL